MVKVKICVTNLFISDFDICIESILDSQSAAATAAFYCIKVYGVFFLHVISTGIFSVDAIKITI